MDYKANDMYKAYRLKLDYLKRKLPGQYAHALSKLGMFAEDAFQEQQATIDHLRQENEDLIELILTSDARAHYLAIQVAKDVAKRKR